MSNGWAGGSTRAWRKVRAAVLDRDGYVCRVGPERRTRGARDVCTHTAREVHHLDGKAQGDDPERCVASCQACNLAEAADEQRTRRDDPAPVVKAWWSR